MGSAPFVMLLSAVLFIGTASAQLAASGTGYARAHIYTNGAIGSCGVKASSKDINGPCGASWNDPCISTSFGGADCGKCFKVTVPRLGTTTYITTQDLNGGDATFEMSHIAWKHLCPKICLGYGDCSSASTNCQYGTVESWHAQGENVKYEQYDCKSGNLVSGGNAGGNSTGNGNGNNSSSKTTTTTTKKAPVATTKKPSKTTTTKKGKTTTTKKSKATTTKKSSSGNNSNNNGGNGTSNNGMRFLVNGSYCCLADRLSTGTAAQKESFRDYCVRNGCSAVSGVCSRC